MINSPAFTARLEQICTHYDLTAAALAEQIGVQRSSISHILSGRNKPSLDFILKVVHRFPEIDLYWLLNGKGEFPSPTPKAAPKPDVRTPIPVSTQKAIDRIVVFYTDGTFDSYMP